eukprot:2696353-Prymnesium_polylepis.1
MCGTIIHDHVQHGGPGPTGKLAPFTEDGCRGTRRGAREREVVPPAGAHNVSNRVTENVTMSGAAAVGGRCTWKGVCERERTREDASSVWERTALESSRATDCHRWSAWSAVCYHTSPD